MRARVQPSLYTYAQYDNMALRVVWVAIEMLGSRARYPHKRAVLTRYWRQWGGLLLTRRLSRRATLHFTDPYARYQTTMLPMCPVVVESHKITSPRDEPIDPDLLTSHKLEITQEDPRIVFSADGSYPMLYDAPFSRGVIYSRIALFINPTLLNATIFWRRLVES